MININKIQTVELKYHLFDNTPLYYHVVVENNNLDIHVPLDEANTDYQAIQEWIADGGTVIDNGGGE